MSPGDGSCHCQPEGLRAAGPPAHSSTCVAPCPVWLEVQLGGDDRLTGAFI